MPVLSEICVAMKFVDDDDDAKTPNRTARLTWALKLHRKKKT